MIWNLAGQQLVIDLKQLKVGKAGAQQTRKHAVVVQLLGLGIEHLQTVAQMPCEQNEIRKNKTESKTRTSQAM